MAIPQSTHYIHWNYFLNLEQDLIVLSRYIEFSEKNYETYSQELAKVFLAASSEFDVVLKQICIIKGLNKSRPNIDDYRNTITSNLPLLCQEIVFIDRYGMELEPLERWYNTSDKNPLWWTDYNTVKHNRNEGYMKANLKNTLNSMAALALVNLYFHYFTFAQERQMAMSEVFRHLKSEPDLISFNQDYHATFKMGPEININLEMGPEI
jgi:hypothetical protein